MNKNIKINNEIVNYQEAYIMHNGEIMFLNNITNHESFGGIAFVTSEGTIRICDLDDADRLRKTLFLCQTQGILYRIGSKNRKQHMTYSKMVSEDEFDKIYANIVSSDEYLREENERLFSMCNSYRSRIKELEAEV